MWKRFVLVCCAFALAGCGSVTPLARTGASDFNSERRQVALDWTVFVYMAGDNNLSSAVDLDLREMREGLNSSRVRFVALVDQRKNGDSRIVEISKDGALNVDDQGAVIPAGHEVDSGKPETLENFLKWGVKHYPSRRSLLVMWNHGHRAFTDPQNLKSFCEDDQSKSHLVLVDLWRALQDLSQQVKFDIIGFDACLMGHIETAYQLRNLSSIFVSSEKKELDEGWDYYSIGQFLSGKPEAYPRELAAEIVKSFNLFYQSDFYKQECYVQTGNVATLSAIDLQKLQKYLVPAVNELAIDLQKGLQQPDVLKQIRQVFQQAAAKYPDESETDALDLGMLASMLEKSQLPQKTRMLAGKVRQELQHSVILNLATNIQPELYTGMKIYAGEDYNTHYGEASRQAFGICDWARFAKAYGSH